MVRQALAMQFWRSNYLMYLEVYSEDKKSIWNEFVRKSKNATFLIMREYMDYHKDRFTDMSLMFYDNKKNLIGILPTNIEGNELMSHGGLTYGGFILDKKMKTTTMLEMFNLLINFCKGKNIKTILYKPIPYIYHEIPSQEDLYALFINNAKLYIRNISSSIKLNTKNDYETRRKRQINKALKNNIIVLETNDYDKYWVILEQNLMEKHESRPVHTVNEIKSLANIFPNNIKLFCSYKDNTLLGGVVVYENKENVHVQYISASEEGKAIGALDIIFDKLINEIYKDKEYFDFGISNENKGRYLNEGLINQKEGFGASAVAYDQYILYL